MSKQRGRPKKSIEEHIGRPLADDGPRYEEVREAFTQLFEKRGKLECVMLLDEFNVQRLSQVEPGDFKHLIRKIRGILEPQTPEPQSSTQAETPLST